MGIPVFLDNSEDRKIFPVGGGANGEYDHLFFVEAELTLRENTCLFLYMC